MLAMRLKRLEIKSQVEDGVGPVLSSASSSGASGGGASRPAHIRKIDVNICLATTHDAGGSCPARANPSGGMSPLAESVEFKPEPEPPLGEEIGDGSQAEAGADAPAEADDPFDPGLAPGVDPGVTLVGRTVQESDVYDTSGELEVRGRVGTVAGTRPHEHLGRVYDVTYSDGKDREVVLEELLLVLWRDESLVSSEIKSARERARAEASPGVGFVGAGRKNGQPVRFSGVRTDDDLRNARPLFYASASVTHTETRTFDMLFNKREGAAAAFDLLVRRLHLVATRTRKRNKNNKRCLVKFHRSQLGRQNFPKATARDLVGIVRATKAGPEDFKSAEELRRDDAESSPSLPDETAARKKQRPNPPSETDTANAKGKGKAKPNAKGKPNANAKPNAKGETATAPPDASRLAADLAFLRSKLAEVREMQRKGDISESDYEKIKAHLIQSMYPPATE